MKNNLKKIGYDRKKLTAGILHIGVGNFHRAHQQYYTHLLMEKDHSQTSWGIAGGRSGVSRCAGHTCRQPGQLAVDLEHSPDMRALYALLRPLGMQGHR